MNDCPDPNWSEEDLRARTLLRLVPRVVHSLNNALAVVQGACELGAQGPQNEHALEKLSILRDTLARLVLLARAPSSWRRSLEVQELFSHLGLLLRPFERSGLRLGLEVRGQATLSVDGGFETLLLASSVALINDAGTNCRLLLKARAFEGWVRFTLLATGSASSPSALEPLEAYAQKEGWRTYRRAARASVGLFLDVPAETGTSRVPLPCSNRSAQHLLLVHSLDEERELISTVLRENGCVVRSCAAEPAEGGRFDLALIERSLVRRDPTLMDRLRARFHLTRIELFDERMRPEDLLAQISPRL